MKQPDYALLGAKSAATDIRAWAKAAAKSEREDVRALIAEALKDGLERLRDDSGRND